MDATYLARDPVTTADGALLGYRLAVRRLGSGPDERPSSPALPASLARSGFYGQGVEGVAGSGFGFVSVDPTLMDREALSQLSPQHTILGLTAESAAARPGAALKPLAQAGFQIAADFGLIDPHELTALLPQLSVLRIDASRIGSAAAATAARSLRRPGLRLLARTRAHGTEREALVAAGFDLFEGLPRFTASRDAHASSPQLLRMLKLLKDDADSSAIVDELKRQPRLSVATLRAANASANARRNIASLQDALAMMGRDRLARLVQMLVFAGDDGTGIHNNVLLQLAVARAKLAEDVAGAERQMEPAERRVAFVLGLLSLIDLVMGVPLRDVVDELGYTSPLREALLHREGRLGLLLELTEKIELGDDESVAALLHEFPSLRGEDLLKLQVGALAWLKRSGVS